MDWSSALTSHGLGDEAPGVFTITDRKVRIATGSKVAYTAKKSAQQLTCNTIAVFPSSCQMAYRCVVEMTLLTFPSIHCVDAGSETIRIMMKPAWQYQRYSSCSLLHVDPFRHVCNAYWFAKTETRSTALTNLVCSCGPQTFSNNCWKHLHFKWGEQAETQHICAVVNQA